MANVPDPESEMERLGLPIGALTTAAEGRAAANHFGSNCAYDSS